MKRINSFLKVLILCVVVMNAPSAMAALIPETETFTEDSTLTFDQFNPDWGTLESIEIVLNLSIDNGWLIADNDGNDVATVMIKLGATATLSSTDVLLLDDSLQPVVGALSALSTDEVLLAADNGDGSGNVDATGPDGTTHYGCPDSNSDSGFIKDTLFADYFGTGTFNITVDISEIIGLDSLGDVEGSFSPVDILSPGSSVTINYTYTPIPEPATMMILGLGSTVFLRRRKP